MKTFPSNIESKIRTLKYEKKSYEAMLNNPKEFPMGFLNGRIETSYQLAKRMIDTINNEILRLKEYK
tara:strand:- start:980 stop:1180 length:201 start_codon:yes stop_codon:yes gene_type:complete